MEARIVAVLLEKEATVRDSYPLSLNALCADCNQKTAREPVMTLGEAGVLAAIEPEIAEPRHEVPARRVVRYEHNLARVLGVPGAAAALLTMLILRGPQTAAELRLHCERLHRFADVSSVEGFLDRLAEKSRRGCRKLPRAPGARESRWAHLLCGDAGLEAASTEVGGGRRGRCRAGGRSGGAARRSPRVARTARPDYRGPRRGAVTMRFEIPDEASMRFTHEMVLPIRWGDMDAMGHVNNTIYFRYLEIVRIDWFERLGAQPDPRGTGPVIVNAFCNFKQLEFPGDVVAPPLRLQPGAQQLRHLHHARPHRRPRRGLRGRRRRTVWVDFPAQKSVPLPDAIRALVSGD